MSTTEMPIFRLNKKSVDLLEGTARVELSRLRLVAPCEEAQASLERSRFSPLETCDCPECQDPCLPPDACA